MRFYLDVDGVLSPIRPLSDHFGDQEQVRDPVTGASFYKSAGLADALRPLIERADDFVWLTTWGCAARRHVEPLLGFPPGRVFEMHETNSSSWWKWEHVAREAAEMPEPFVWVDDELAGHVDLLPSIKRWADSIEVPHCLVSPDPAHGLERQHLEQIATFLGSNKR